VLADDVTYIMDLKEKQPGSTEIGRCTVHAIEYNPSTATWFLWLHVMKKHLQSRAFSGDW